MFTKIGFPIMISSKYSVLGLYAKEDKKITLEEILSLCYT